MREDPDKIMYITDDVNCIYNNDCMDILPYMRDKSVDIVFMDPPYNVGKKYDGYDDAMDSEDYRLWMSKVIHHCNRISKRGIVIYIPSKLMPVYFTLVPLYHMVVIVKRASGIRDVRNYAIQYHLLLSTVTPLVRCKDVWDDIRLPGEGYYFKEPRYDNPGMTSELLIEKVLHYFTKDGDIVLDPFMGCGATAEACMVMDRKFIGIEQSTKYCDMALKRLGE